MDGFLFEPCDGSSLSMNRIFLGVLMLLDLVHERGLSQAHLNLANDTIFPQCRFPVFQQVTRFSNPEAMFAVYAVMFVSLLGIIVGFYYRLFTLLYATGFWYLLIIDKSRWNNHSYLFGILALQSVFNDANCCFSIDSYRLDLKNSVPKWQYFLLRFQLFLVYFYAGVKKFDSDWLGGYSMVNLSQHWAWTPFR